MPEPITPNPQGQGAAGGGQEPPAGAQTPPAQSIYKDLQVKKGFKSEEDLAKSYIEAEQSLGKHQNLNNKVKQQLESAGYTIDDEGNVKPVGQPSGQPLTQPGGQPGGYPGQPVEQIYDPYTGQIITDPIAIQLARMPLGMREATVVNAIIEQREKQQIGSYQAEAEVLSTPEAKGFEDDVRNVMRQVPLAQRANKQSWQDALLRVKGMRYDQAVKNAGQQGVEAFLNKEGIQIPEGSGGQQGVATLTAEQEQVYRYYQQNYPGMFKDKAAFLRANSPTGGR